VVEDDAMRALAFLILAGALVASSGCMSVLGTLLAPESVVTTAADNFAVAGAQTLSGASLEELSSAGNTINELNQILQNNPDAVNADQIAALRDRMQDTGGRGTGPDQRQIAREPPAPRRASDQPLPVRRGDQLKVSPPGDAGVVRRPPSRPDTLPAGSALKDDGVPVHAMSLTPIRLH
jgi:hypothetical protein